MKAILILVCVILFFWVMARIGKKFKDSQWVAEAKFIEVKESLTLPEITICPSKPFKEDTNDTILNFETLTYEKDELIHELGLNWTFYSTQIHSLTKGKCFTAFFNQKVKAKTCIETFYLQKGIDYDIYLHTSGT